MLRLLQIAIKQNWAYWLITRSNGLSVVIGVEKVISKAAIRQLSKQSRRLTMHSKLNQYDKNKQ